jgi:inner membrane protein
MALTSGQQHTTVQDREAHHGRSRLLEAGFGLAVPACLLALIGLCDHVLTHGALSVRAQAPLDETGHASTAALILLALAPRLSRRFVVAVLLGSVLIDVDHMPMVLGYAPLTPNAHRPYTHSLSTVAALLALSLLIRPDASRIGIAFACGIALHFTRDVATNYVPLLWPMSSHEVAIAYAWYVVIVASAAIVAACRAYLRIFRGQRAFGPGYVFWEWEKIPGDPPVAKASRRESSPI